MTSSAIDPYDPSFSQSVESFDINQLNSLADSYAGSATQNGVVPDPQLFTQSAPVGATPSLSYSFGQSSTIDNYMSALPIGNLSLPEGDLLASQQLGQTSYPTAQGTQAYTPVPTQAP